MDQRVLEEWSKMRAWTKKDFDIVGHRTGSRLLGHENDYVYEIRYEGRVLGDMTFTSKAKAGAWLGKFLKKANMIRKERKNG